MYIYVCVYIYICIYNIYIYIYIYIKMQKTVITEKLHFNSTQQNKKLEDIFKGKNNMCKYSSRISLTQAVHLQFCMLVQQEVRSGEQLDRWNSYKNLYTLHICNCSLLALYSMFKSRK